MSDIDGVDEAVEFARRVSDWVGRSDISARSVLVTILGDSIAPLGGTIWLTDLFLLAARFGFSERLVRTSMFRLVSEGWVQSERFGRRSRYSLTEFAVSAFADADKRIYYPRPTVEAWTGQWTWVLAHTDLTPPVDRDRLVDHLRWQGFAELAKGVWAVPSDKSAVAEGLSARLELGSAPPVAVAEFTDLERLVKLGFFGGAFGLDDAEQAYQSFIEQYRWADQPAALSNVQGADAFTLRTMLIHDLRRARLSDPDLPEPLLPPDWIADDAYQLAANVYGQLADLAWEAIDEMTELSSPSADPRIEGRFGERRP